LKTRLKTLEKGYSKLIKKISILNNIIKRLTAV